MAASTTASDVGSTRLDAGLDHAAETGSDVSALLRAIPRTAGMGPRLWRLMWLV